MKKLTGFLWCFGVLFFTMLLSLGCNPVPGQVAINGPPDFTGFITELNLRSDDPTMGTILVESHADKIVTQYLVTIRSQTQIILPDGSGGYPGTIADLALKQWVQVWFDGPVKESFPMQVAAGRIAVMETAVPSPETEPTPEEPVELTAEEGALDALTRFFGLLADRNYDAAVPLYGGDYSVLRDLNPDLDSSDHAGLFRRACQVNGFQCLRVLEAELVSQDGERNFTFQVVFQTPDGIPFVQHPCCGASEIEQPSQFQFSYSVVKNAQAVFLVMELPVYVP